MEIKRTPPDPDPAPPEWFTGEVEIAQLAAPEPPARVRVLRVRFAARSRTAWHTHPLGQLIHIVEGAARVQREGGPVEEVPTGGTAWFPPGERHWHGATPDGPMTHLAIQEADADGTTVDWEEHVSDDEYDG